VLQDFKVYQPSVRDPAPEPNDLPMAETGTVQLTPTKPDDTIVIEAVLNRRLTVPMLLEPGLISRC